MKKEYIVYKLSECAKQACRIDNELFTKYNVKRGLRNEDGTGVLVGLTKIGNVVGYERTEEGLKPIPGKLFYRGYDLADIVHALLKEKRFGFEEVAYLLLSGELPDNEQLDAFKELINDNMPLDKKTTMNIIDLEGQNIMNILARSVLEMYTFDPNPDDISRDNLMRQSIELISKFPTIIAYAYNIYRHSIHGRSLHIRHPHENLSIAENFLYMMKKEYTPLEARMLDLLLVAVKPEYQNKGVNALLFSDLIPVYQQLGFEYAESNPELELNGKVQAQWDYFRTEQHKRRRAFVKEIGN